MSRNISIIIATYNRADYLKETLRSLFHALESYAGSVEVIVVNNNSSDNTEEVVSQFAVGAGSTSLRLVRETRQGLSHARNKGLCESKGAIICFLDDDVYVSETWLPGILAAFSLADDIGAVAGRIELHWEAQPQALWLDPHYLRLFSRYYDGEQSKILAWGTDFFGANFALRREVVEKTGTFDIRLGRKKTNLLSGEETDYAERIWRNGYRIAYSANGLVYHRVHAERASFRWLLRRFLWAGVSSYFLPKNRYLHYPLTKLLKAIENSIILSFSVLLYRKKRIIRSIFRLFECLGAFYGVYLDITHRN